MQAKRLSRVRSKSKWKAINKGAHTFHLMALFEEQLKDILWVEKALIKAIPKMITLATSEDLILELMGHLHQTHEKITRLAKVFNTIEKKPKTIKCDAMEGLITEAIEMMKDCEKGPKCDAGIIAAAQKIKHYEITTCGTMWKFAKTLGLREAEYLLKETLKEEKEADQKLADVAAVNGVNKEAASAQI